MRSRVSALEARTTRWLSASATSRKASWTPEVRVLAHPEHAEQLVGGAVGVEVGAVVEVAVAGDDVAHRHRRLVDRVLVEGRQRHGRLSGLGGGLQPRSSAWTSMARRARSRATQAMLVRAKSESWGNSSTPLSSSVRRTITMANPTPAWISAQRWCAAERPVAASQRAAVSGPRRQPREPGLVEALGQAGVDPGEPAQVLAPGHRRAPSPSRGRPPPRRPQASRGGRSSWLPMRLSPQHRARVVDVGREVLPQPHQPGLGHRLVHPRGRPTGAWPPTRPPGPPGGSRRRGTDRGRPGPAPASRRRGPPPWRRVPAPTRPAGARGRRPSTSPPCCRAGCRWAPRRRPRSMTMNGAPSRAGSSSTQRSRGTRRSGRSPRAARTRCCASNMSFGNTEWAVGWTRRASPWRSRTAPLVPGGVDQDRLVAEPGGGRAGRRRHLDVGRRPVAESHPVRAWRVTSGSRGLGRATGRPSAWAAWAMVWSSR